MSVRMKDIARHLGVSQTTVSHVLRGRHAEYRIGSQTAIRVREAAETLGYHPSALGRNLKYQRANTLALAVGDLSNPFWAGLAVAAQLEAERYGYMLVVNNTGESLQKERQLLEMLRQKRVDGLILSAGHLKPRDLTKLSEERRPLVLVDRTIDGLDLPSVVTDSLAGLKMAVDHLVSRGHRRIGFLGGPNEIITFRERRRGYREAMMEQGLRLGPFAVAEATPEAAEEAVKSLFGHSSSPTALIAANIWLTMGALRGSPDDIDVVGFDDIYLADMLRRRVTTIAQPVEDLGRNAVRLLLEEIAHPGTNHQVVLPPHIIVR